MAMLKRLTLRGYKSIRDSTLELRSLNVMIGANGAGKSNLISFFRLLNEMMGGRLQQFVASSGRAHGILHFGPKKTPRLEASLEFEADEAGLNAYRIGLSYAAGDSLAFNEETLTHSSASNPEEMRFLSLNSGSQESEILEAGLKGESLARHVRFLVSGCRVYHFHDTSSTARARQYCYVGDDRSLMHDGGNLAALLYRLRNEQEGAYRRIVGTVRLIAPFFADFELEPSGPLKKDIILNWRERNSDQVFGPHQLSDGTLRAICLVSLLLQPEDDLPNLIVVDEPELGLHPYALDVVASLFSKAAEHVQVLISTQSSAFLDNFEPKDVIVVDREERGGTAFVRLDPQKLEAWLEEYSLGEVWEKNVVGGGPH